MPTGLREARRSPLGSLSGGACTLCSADGPRALVGAAGRSGDVDAAGVLRPRQPGEGHRAREAHVVRSGRGTRPGGAPRPVPASVPVHPDCAPSPAPASLTALVGTCLLRLSAAAAAGSRSRQRNRRIKPPKHLIIPGRSLPVGGDDRVRDWCGGAQMHVLMCLLDVASAMAYLHSVGVLHGDLKSANVLLKSTATDLRGYVCKLADFG